jgi:hypothetical protein
MTANRPAHGPGIQNRSGFIALFYYLSRQQMNVHSTLGENTDSMMAVQNGSVRTNLQASLFAGSERYLQLVSREGAKEFEFD